jgi:glycosyltransferase involved in cell wall biosynthesis
MTLIFTVTNDLTYDQRMHRICGTLAEHGYAVTLVGRAMSHSIPLEIKAFEQKRLRCFFQKGFAFYAEYNLRLCWFLLFARCDAVCSIDLDTLPAGCLATLLRRKKRVFDAHEHFTEVPEVVGRPVVKFFWEMVARTCLPFYRHAYTVGPALAGIFEKKYGLKFEVVRNVAGPSLSRFIGRLGEGPGLLYQGALNAGRGIEALLEAMQHLDNVTLALAGEGDLSEALRQKARELQLEKKVVFLGYVQPADLKRLTAQAWLGLNLLENRGQSYYYSLANKFFDYVQAEVPVLTMDFPEYRALNAQHEVAILLPTLDPATIADSIRNLLENKDLYQKLQENCRAARTEWNWQHEQKILLALWAKVARAHHSITVPA